MNKRYIIFSVVLAVIVLLNLPMPVSLRLKSGTRDNIAPFRNGMSLILGGVQSYVTSIFHARDILAEKEQMLSRIANLQYEVKTHEKLRADNDELRKHLGFNIRQDHRLIISEVAERSDITGWWQTVRLNKGSKDGVRPDMAVMTVNGLVGKTHMDETLHMVISQKTSDVLLLTDPKCKVACKVERTGSFGILKGSGVIARRGAEMEMLSAVQPNRMDYMNKDHKLVAGDEVVTSGLGGVYPEGLQVGEISKVELDSSGLYQRAHVVLSEQMESLKYVFIVDDDKESESQ